MPGPARVKSAMIAPPRLALTGANGFLGRHTARAAVRAGWAVTGIVRRPAASAAVESLGGRAAVVPSLEPDALAGALSGCRAVVHLAGIARRADQSFDEVNVGGARAVARAADRAGVARLVVPSGLGVDRVGTRDWADNDYFRSKRDVEAVVLDAVTPAVVFRPSYILGPGDELVPYLVRTLLAGDAVRLVDGGTSPMQPIFVEDAVAAFVAAAAGRGPDRAIYDLVGPRTVNLRALVEMVAAALRARARAVPPVKFVPVASDRAVEALGLSKEEVDVMRCDVVGDAEAGPRGLGYRLTPVEAAVDAAVAAEVAP